MPAILRPVRRQVNAKGLLRLPRVLYGGSSLPSGIISLAAAWFLNYETRVVVFRPNIFIKAN